MARSNEPLWWAPFSAGMMVGALFIPALVVITGGIWPEWRSGAIQAEHVQDLLKHPLTRIFLAVVISLSFFHFAHRFRYTVLDLGFFKESREKVAMAAYGFAVVGTIVTVVIAAGLL